MGNLNEMCSVMTEVMEIVEKSRRKGEMNEIKKLDRNWLKLEKRSRNGMKYERI